jgi:hypothetical protein
MALLAASVIGCTAEPPEAAKRLASVKEESAELDRVLDDVEERLLGNQAQVHLWQELGRRHQSVSALACENLSGHLLEMAKNLDVQQERSQRIRRARTDTRKQAVSAAPLKDRRSGSN